MGVNDTVKIAVALVLILFLVSIGGLMFNDNIYTLLGSADAQVLRTVREVFRTDGVIPVLQGLLIVSGLGLAIMGVSYGSRT